MSDPQKETINLLESKGYVLERDSVWPIYTHPDTGCRIQIAFDGRQVNVGYARVHRVGHVPKTCPVCKQPVGEDHPKADVYHLECIMKITEHLRKNNEQATDASP